jgi:ApbE superfamily uncharacterized protein (UPF0280 family)
MNGAQITRLADGRLHLHHGPIDLICEAWGMPSAVAQAYRHAIHRFDGLLEELVAELPALRRENAALHGPIARKMGAAVVPFHPAFITPMAAVAGSVAETILAAMGQAELSRAYVNNGGDIALHLTPGQSLTAAIAGTPHRATLRACDPARGIATSGWRGRSFSLGIADSVTVLAKTAAMADAAATMIANAVDLPLHPAILRAPASSLQIDNDLGHRFVTTAVGPLTQAETDRALDNGIAFAQTCLARGLILGAALCLNSHLRTLGATLLEPAHA